jgi:hypothetical protein
MSGNPAALVLERDHFKYLFLTSYFDLKDYEHVPAEPMAFIRNYLAGNFNIIDDNTLKNYLGYLKTIQLKHINAPIINNNSNIITTTTTSPTTTTPTTTTTTVTDVYKYVKPQFRFMCDRATIDILEFDPRMYIQPGVHVYATNFFTSNPAKLMTFFYAEFSKVNKNKLFVNTNSTGCILTGNSGFLFDDAFVDWSGVRMCTAPRLENNAHPYRLYLLGDEMANHFINNNILPPLPPSRYRKTTTTTTTTTIGGSINNTLFMLKNFYKGLPLFRLKYTVVNSTKMITRKPNEVFSEIDKELNNNSPFIKFIQRDYIYDAANFPNDLLDVLNNYMTKSSIMKIITKFIVEDTGRPVGDVSREIIIDRYAVDCYRKLYIKMELTNNFPVMYDHESSYIFVTKDFMQIKNTMNAFYAPKHRLLGILAVNRLFGATETLNFHPNLLVYRQSSPPIRLTSGDVYLVDKNEKVFLVKHIFSNTVPAYLLIRGDYESSSELRPLRDLNPWVQNTILQLLVSENNSQIVGVENRE